MNKLYVVTRADIEPGAVVAQSGHAVAEYARLQRETFEIWHDGPNNLVVLACRDELALADLTATAIATAGDDAVAVVREPDLDNQMTSISFIGTPELSRLVSNLPLALKVG